MVNSRSLALLAMFAVVLAVSSSVTAADYYETEFVNEYSLDIDVQLAFSSKDYYRYKGVDEFTIHGQVSRVISYSLQKVLNIFDVRALLWEVKAVVDGELKHAFVLVPFDAKVVITVRAAGPCADVYVSSKISHRPILVGRAYLH
ncbi:hypothetical protein MPTK1_4g16010 [Marchantia polymorpha subsp. ruderalis]|uniref:Lipid-binding serum glycoprotein N-terminal domain-containing protein n=2 Tax=Marchantia polymorpha TaxID=3197 RepID=A0AAF6BAD3_MARPO|nr:hypothetical protein MARPO_0054s0066 [Marchantia polymorpha]BBN08967.1 hypothetical protein Mp_4g16010 [Marchantia polymorpha subsp. ruderalis]|eukprot:PTQ37954.1 hypothetical protein MARPO_0054s0066 [Marchantia polymorpha]